MVNAGGSLPRCALGVGNDDGLPPGMAPQVLWQMVSQPGSWPAVLIFSHCRSPSGDRRRRTASSDLTTAERLLGPRLMRSALGLWGEGGEMALYHVCC